MKGADHFGALAMSLRIPIVGIGQRENIRAAERDLTIDNLHQRRLRIFENLIHHEKSRRASVPRLTMKMQPRIFRQFVDKIDELLDNIRVGRDHVGGGNSDVIKIGVFNDFAFDLHGADFDRLRRKFFRIRFAERNESRFRADKCSELFLLVALDLGKRFSGIGVIMFLMPTHRQLICKAMRFLPKIDNVN